jgi:hypothetical protein
MTYKVSVSSGNNYSVKYSQPANYKTSLSYDITIMPQNLNELSDVELSGNNYDRYVLVYDSVSGKWKDMNPDVVLSAATTTPDANRTTFTLPTDFENKLDVDLDNKIDLDAGTF